MLRKEHPEKLSIPNTKWYSKLYENGLFANIPKESVRAPNIVVQYEGDFRQFRLFETPSDLFNHIQTYPIEDRHFYEVILENRPVKPFLDIDIEDENLKELLKSGVKMREKDLDLYDRRLEVIGYCVRQDIINAFQLLGIQPEEVRIYSSSSKTKKSYHIVLPGYYFESIHIAKRLHYYLSEKMCREYSRYIDVSVYKSLQLFRLLGSCKKPKAGEEPRTKRLEYRWTFQGEEIVIDSREPFDEFYESLLGQIDPNVKPFNLRELPELEVTKSTRFSLDYLIADEVMNEANKVVLEKIGDSIHFYRQMGNLLSYSRTKPGFCPICERTHDNIAPFAKIYPTKGYWALYLFCARAKVYVDDLSKRKLYLCRFEERSDEESNENREGETTIRVPVSTVTLPSDEIDYYIGEPPSPILGPRPINSVANTRLNLPEYVKNEMAKEIKTIDDHEESLRTEQTRVKNQMPVKVRPSEGTIRKPINPMENRGKVQGTIKIKKITILN